MGQAATRSIAGLEHCAHPLVDQVDGFERPKHDFEFKNQAGIVPFDEIDSVDEYSVDFGLKRFAGFTLPNT